MCENTFAVPPRLDASGHGDRTAPAGPVHLACPGVQLVARVTGVLAVVLGNPIWGMRLDWLPCRTFARSRRQPAR